jgi:hypothetical protein
VLTTLFKKGCRLKRKQDFMFCQSLTERTKRSDILKARNDFSHNCTLLCENSPFELSPVRSVVHGNAGRPHIASVAFGSVIKR